MYPKFLSNSRPPPKVLSGICSPAIPTRGATEGLRGQGKKQEMLQPIPGL